LPRCVHAERLCVFRERDNEARKDETEICLFEGKTKHRLRPKKKFDVSGNIGQKIRVGRSANNFFLSNSFYCTDSGQNKLVMGRYTENRTETAVFYKPMPTSVLEKPKNTEYRTKNTDISVFFRYYLIIN
jgi:hypothetical protein